MTEPADRSMTHTVWHTRSTDETANGLHSDVARGLGSADAAERLIRYGPNALGETKQRSLFTILVHQFRRVPGTGVPGTGYLTLVREFRGRVT